MSVTRKTEKPRWTREGKTREELFARLAEPFDPDEIELLPRYTGPRDVPRNQREKRKCAECGGYHEFPCIHLSYVGHAGITMRLNEVDPEWTWEPMARDEHGMPVLDKHGGLWGRLTVLGVTKPAYGDPGIALDGSRKDSPDGVKEMIGDLIRNGAMRFGCGTHLWSKSERAKAEMLRHGVDVDESVGKPDKGQRDDALGASDKQRRAIYAISNKLGLDEESLKIGLIKAYGHAHPGWASVDDVHVSDLTPEEASDLIDRLRAKERGAGGEAPSSAPQDGA